MPFELLIGLRYLKSKRRSAFISLITWISVGGVALGVMALIVVLAVMNGFEEDLRDKILGTNAHVVVFEQGEMGMGSAGEVMRQIATIPHVVGVAPFVYNQIMLSSERSVFGVAVRGIDPRLESRVADLGRHLEAGRVQELERPGASSTGAIIIGKELAKLLGVGVGEEVNAISPVGRVTPAGMVPRLKRFRVAGIFNTGMFEYDSSLAYMSIPDAQLLFNMGERVTGVAVKVDDIYAASQIGQQIRQHLGFPYLVRDWVDMNRNLFSALKIEKIVMFVILILIILVAAFNIISTLIMVTMEKRREIAILKSMGATHQSILGIFSFQGLVIGVSGTLLGVLGGLAVAPALNDIARYVEAVTNWLLGWWGEAPIHIFPKSVYYLDRIPAKLQGMDVAWIVGFAILMSFLAALYPAWRASKLQPAEVLRYE